MAYSLAGTAVAESLSSTRFSLPLDWTGFTLKTLPEPVTVAGAAPAVGLYSVAITSSAQLPRPMQRVRNVDMVASRSSGHQISERDILQR